MRSIHERYSVLVLLGCLAGGAGARGQVPFVIEGVADKANYADQVSLRVPASNGFTYAVFLGTNPVPTSVFVPVTRPDFYQLYATRRETGSGTVSNRLIRFLVVSSERGNTEWGLPPHTPLPSIPSASNEFGTGRVRVLAPRSFPAGFDLPVVAWLERSGGQIQRANGQFRAGAFGQFEVRRGVGSGFLSNLPNGVSAPGVSVGTLSSNLVLDIAASTSWSSAPTVVNGSISWPPHSRIAVTSNLTVSAGATLTIGAGSILRLNPRIDITNNGTILIAGTTDEPVVFMPTNRASPWGGFIMRNSGAGVITATGTIFTGSGAEPSWFGANGNPGSHRREQALFFCQGGQQINLTDCAAIYLAGQLGHSVSPTTTTPIRLTRFLMQRATTGGEFTGAEFSVEDAAFIECPDPSINFVDGDNDGLYLVSGTHGFTNTLFGWVKDDGVDSGGDSVGRLHYERCWFEATFHEGNSLSGLKNTTAFRTVYYDCGQGLEDGYGAGGGGPTGRVDRCLFVNCESGARHGDNYPSIGNGYPGLLVVTNSVLINNHRDVFGYNWRSTGWTNSGGQMFIRGNHITGVDTNFPVNDVWNPSTDGWMLASYYFGRYRVGVGIALHPGQTSLTNMPNGIPVALSIYCTNEVTVDYAAESTSGTAISGRLRFAPGQILRFIPAPSSITGVYRVRIFNPVNAEITGLSSVNNQNFAPASNTTLIATGSVWRYLDDGSNQGTVWRGLNFNDSGWSNGVAELGFGDNNEATVVRRVNSMTGLTNITYYFRRTVSVANPAAYSTLALRLKYDDGGVVYLNSNEVFRVNLPAGIITSSTTAPVTVEDAIGTTNLSGSLLRTGQNVVAAEIHQESIGSSDISFDLSLVGQVDPSPRLYWGYLGTDIALYWDAAGYVLEGASAVKGPWSTVASVSPFVTAPEGTRFYRLRK